MYSTAGHRQKRRTKHGPQQAAQKNFMVTPCINNAEPFLLPTDAHNLKKHGVFKTF